MKFLDGVEDDSADIVPGLTTFLEPAAPSPFTSSTEIAYTLAEESPVTLKVFDFFYVHVATLVEKDSQPPGRYVVPFAPGGSIASGMYFYTLETHEDRLIRRFLYLR